MKSLTKIDLMILGDAGVGKTSLLRVFQGHKNIKDDTD